MARFSPLLALVSTLALCQAGPLFMPSGKEMIYTYEALINVGTYEPAPFASQFILNGTLHMQKLDDKHIMMKMTDMTYKLYNGELIDGHEEHLKSLAMPEETHDLVKPFMLTYDSHGKIQTIITEKDDKKFSRNMKKGIGSLMQLDMEHIKLDAKHGYVFKTWENTLYGKTHVKYHVMPEHDEIIIDKMLDINMDHEHHTNVRHWKAFFATTGDLNRERDPMTTGSHKTYTLTKKDNEEIIKEIKSQGSTYLTPMKGRAESMFMLVEQDMELLEMVPITTPMTKPQNELEDKMKFELEDTEEDEHLVDIAFGRHTHDMKKFEERIYKMFEEGIKHMDVTHLKMEVPDLKNAMWMNKVRRIMSFLDLKTLEHMFVTMEEKTTEKDKEMFNMFQQMLPFIGTRATMLQMRNLIRKQKITDEMAMSMLTQMPFHMRMPTEKLITEMEDFIHMENVNETIQRTATLTFANMVNKVFTHDLQQTGEKVHSEMLEKYITKFMDLLKNAQDYSHQYLYMNALFNIRLGSVQKQLEPYVTGEATHNRHLRYLAMCASYAEVTKDQARVFELYWPIFADPELHLELRVGAYLTIMATKPNKEKLMDIYWILKSDPCPELYHMHWSYLRSMEFTTVPEMQGWKEMATEMINFMREPMHHTLTGHYMMDFMDPNFGFGSLMSATIMSTNTSKTLYLDMGSDMYNFPIVDWAIWIKIDGMEPSVMAKTKVEIANMENNFMLESLLQMIFSLKDQKNLHIEYAILQNDRIIMMDYADHSTLDKLKIDIETIVDMADINLSFDQVTQVLIPNDLGLPTVLEMLMPAMSDTDLDLNHNKIEGQTTAEGYWKQAGMHYVTQGMKFYNPISDAYQGVINIKSNEMLSAMNFKFAMTKDYKLKMTIDKMDDESMDKFAFRHYEATLVYVKELDENQLQKSSKDSHHTTEVSRGDNYRGSKMLFEHDCPHTGLLFQIGIFDNQRHISKLTMMHTFWDITQRYFKNYQTMPFGYRILTMKHFLKQLLNSPEIGTMGFTIRATPSKKHPVNHIDITLRALLEDIKEEHHTLTTTKLNTRFTWATKSKDNKVQHSWDTNAIMDMSPGHELNNFKVHLSMEQPGEKQFKMCLVGMKKWVNTKIVGQMNITMGHTEDPTACVDNEGLIEIDMKGEQSEDQKHMLSTKQSYETCLPTHMHEPLLEDLHVDYHETIECTRKQTSLRWFEYDIKTTGLSEKCKHMMENFLDCMKGWMMPYFSHEKTNIALDDHHMKVITDYPVDDHEMNMQIITPKETYRFTEAPHSMMSWMGFGPESYHYYSFAEWLQKMGMTEFCMIVDNHIYNDNYDLMKIENDDWMMVVQNNLDLNTKHTMNVFVKRMKDKEMALRVKMDEKILEIIPEGDNYKITWDGKPMTVTEGSYQREDMFSIGMLHDEHRTLILHILKGLYIDFDGEQIRMDKRKMNMHLIGPCFVN